MNLFSRRSIYWIVGTVLILFIGIGLYGYFIGTRTLLQHAETLNLRRLQVTSLPDQDAHRFFYASNRQLNDSGVSLENRYLSSRAETLNFGHFDVRVEPSLGIGMLVNPSEWLINEEIQLLSVQARERASFIEALREQVERSPERSLLLVIHGFRESYPSALRKTAFLSHVLDIDTPMLLFDWPGDQGSSLRGYRRARQVAIESAAELAETLRLISDEVQPERLWLLANSMGAQVVVHAMNQLYQDQGFSDAGTEIEHVVLTAADSDHSAFNQQFKHEMASLADRVTVYVSSNDRALFASRLINRGQRLGESTFDPGNPDMTLAARSFAELLENNTHRLALVDVTPVNRTRNFHNFSLETPEFFDDLFLRLTQVDPPLTRELYPVLTPEGKHYFILTRSR